MKWIALLVALGLICAAPASAASLSMRTAKRAALDEADFDAALLDGVVYAGPVCARKSTKAVRCGYRIQYTIYEDLGNLIGFDESHVHVELLAGHVFTFRVAPHRGWTRGLSRHEDPLPPLKP